VSFADLWARSAHLSITELLGFITGAVCVWLLVKQNIWTWPTGIANNILSIVVFYRARLFGDMSLQFFFIAVAIYGWWHWLHPDDRHRGEVKVTRIPAKATMVLVALTAAATYILVQGLRQIPGTTPWPDASTTCMSLAAQFMQSRKWIENWAVWIAVDVISIALYLYKGLGLFALLYAVFLAMCIAGLVEWRRDLRRSEMASV
jgi:nicotinamide mononucleotide transporter